MIDIARHIEYLLIHHDCVVVPGLGAFMINEEGAGYDAENKRLLPPSRSVGFNPEVRHNDALLVGSISRREGMSIDAARGELDTEVASMLHQIQLCGEIPVGNLGVLRRGITPESPVFYPSADSLPVRICTGLVPVEAEPLVTEREDETAVAETAHERVVTIPMPLKIVASIVAVMVGLGILYSTTSLVNGPRANYASLDTGIGSRLEQSCEVEEMSAAASLSREILLNIARPVVEADVNKADKAETAEKPGRYILVVGSFPTLKAAQRHISHTGDPSLKVIEMEGNYRVYAASASNINDARDLADSLSPRYEYVWVCRR